MDGMVTIVVRVQTSFEMASPKLYMCSTPIGNLDDASFRLIQTLREADVIAAEDTRHTRKLLSRFEIQPKALVSYHQHNWKSRSDSFVRWWQEGKSIALVSDAGTPGVSDPGAEAVALAIAHDVPVVPIPGASAVLSAIVSSGLPVQPFAFIGFLPRNKKSVRLALSELQSFPGTLVFYESPHRLHKTLSWMAEWWPARDAVLAKELTKRHETFISGTIAELAEFAGASEARGEYVILVGPPVSAAVEPGGLAGAGVTAAVGVDSDDVEAVGLAGLDGLGSLNGLGGQLSEQARVDAAVRAVLEETSRGTSHTEAVRRIAQQTGVRRKTLYQATLNVPD